MRKYNPLEVISFVESKLSKVRNEMIILTSRSFWDAKNIDTSITKDIKIDFILPEGCSELKIDGPCFVCIINQIDTSFFELVEKTKKFYSQNSMSGCFIVLNNNEDYDGAYKWRRKYIQVKSFSSWVKRFKTISIGFNTYIDNELFQPLLLEQAGNAIKNNKVTLFVGAGLGASMHLPDWKLLLKNIWYSKPINFNEQKIDDVVEKSPLQKARFMFSAFKEDDYNNIWKQLYNQIPPDSELLKTIGGLYKKDKIDSIITYNYDDYIERQIGYNNCKSIYRGIRAEGKFPVYHVHGLIPKRKTGDKNLINGIVLTENQYHALYNKAYSWVNVEQYHALSRKTCFFIGMSMTDPNLRRLLDAVQTESQSGDHYVFMAKNDSKIGNDNEKMFAFASLMANLGVSVIWCDDFDDIPNKIKSVFGI